jgi:hypothetical protein
LAPRQQFKLGNHVVMPTQFELSGHPNLGAVHAQFVKPHGRIAGEGFFQLSAIK